MSKPKKAPKPIVKCAPWTPEEREASGRRFIQILHSPSPCYGRDLDDALAFVVGAFRYKTRKGTDIPYLTHLLTVMALVGEHGGSEEQMIAALLHDALEDLEDVSTEDLERRFGGTVTDMVVALSDTFEHPKPDWRTRKTRYLERLAAEGSRVKLVCAADKLHNVQCLLRDLERHGDAIWSRFNAGREDQIWYYQAAIEALATGWKNPLLEELRSALRALNCFQEALSSNHPDAPCICDAAAAQRFVSSWTGLDSSLVGCVLDAKFRYLELAGIALSDSDDGLLRERAIYRHLLPETSDFIDERERIYLALVTGLDEDTILRVEQGDLAYKDSLDIIEWDGETDRDSRLGGPELAET